MFKFVYFECFWIFHLYVIDYYMYILFVLILSEEDSYRMNLTIKFYSNHN